jgi:tRNA threonylcarbamoyladenosine biosynthesis protein TsaB
MALILHLETSTKICSVALSRDGKVLFSKIDTTGPSHAVQLGLFVDEALKVAEESGSKLDAVAISSGPGSYTGLRIGVSMAKGVCYGADAKVITIPTLDLLADQVSRTLDLPENALICPMLDARRMEVYAALYDARGNRLKPVEALIIDEGSFAEELGNAPVWFVGDGAEKCKSRILSDRAHFDGNVFPKAEAMVYLAEKAYLENDFGDVAYFEPFYLKEFVATVSKKQIIPTK